MNFKLLFSHSKSMTCVYYLYGLSYSKGLGHNTKFRYNFGWKINPNQICSFVPLEQIFIRNQILVMLLVWPLPWRGLNGQAEPCITRAGLTQVRLPHFVRYFGLQSLYHQGYLRCS